MLDISVEISDRLQQLPYRAQNKAFKTAMTEQLVKHYRERIPKHFRHDAKSRYRYKQRSPVYLAKKLKAGQGDTDLVRAKSRKLMNSIKSEYKIRIGGTVQGSLKASRAKMPGLLGQLIMRMPFPIGYRDSRRPDRVHTTDLADEITSTTPDEEMEIATGFRDAAVRELNSFRGNIRGKVYGAKK